MSTVRYYPYTRHVLAGGHECVLRPFDSDHQGIDLTDWNAVQCNADVEVVAFADGIVTDVTKGEQIGYAVSVLHNGGLLTRYWHMKAGSVQVNCGQAVKRGDVLGLMGSTGTAAGGVVHLHFAVKTGSESWDTGVYVDPQPYLMGYKLL